MLRPHLLVAANAWETIRYVSERAVPREAGGILVGYRMGADVVVDRAIEVPDPDADRHRYVRRQTEAQRMLDDVLYAESRSSLLGWVGDFHSHPADRPPTRQDRRTLRRNARADGQALAMLVAVRRRDSWQPFGYVAGHWWTREATVTITSQPHVAGEERGR